MKQISKLAIYFIGLILFSITGCRNSQASYQTTGYVESQLFYVTSPSGGKLKKLNVHEGQNLAKDDKIITIEGQDAIKAPADSKVDQIFYQINEFIPPNDPIISLVLPSQMRIIFYIPEEHLNKIKLGKKIFVLLNNKKHFLKITYIANEAEFTPDTLFNEKNSYKLVYKIKANVTSFDLQNLLKIGQPVEVNYE